MEGGEDESSPIPCKYCSHEIDATAKFCPECGEKVVKTRNTCPRCKQKIKKDSKFCEECGKKLTISTDQKPDEDTEDIFYDAPQAPSHSTLEAGEDVHISGGIKDRATFPETKVSVLKNIILQTQDWSHGARSDVQNKGSFVEKDIKQSTKDSEGDNGETLSKKMYAATSYKGTRLMSSEPKQEDWTGGTTNTETGLTNETPHQTKAIARKKIGDNIRIHFHVVVSPEFNFDSKKEDVYIHYEMKTLKGWENLKEEPLEETRKLEKKHTLAKGSIDVPKTHLRGGGQLLYKYVIHRKHPGKEKHNKQEHVYRKFKDDGIENREMQIPETYLNSENEWHQYDGIMHAAPKTGVLSSIERGMKYVFQSFFQKVTDEAKWATLVMMPTWEGFCLKKGKTDDDIAQDVLKQVKQVLQCAGKYFVKDDLSHDQDCNKTIIKEYIAPRMKEFQHQTSETQKEVSLRLISALSIAYLLHEFDLSLRYDEKRTLCEALLPPMDGQFDFVSMVEHHFPDWKSLILQCLLKFMNNCYKKQPKWIYAVPLFHILKEEIHPYQPVHSINHRSIDWWGVKDIESIVNQSDKATLAFHQMEAIAGSFAVDHLFPRTLVYTTIHIEGLRIPQSPVFEPDVCLGLLYHQLKRETFHTKDLHISLYVQDFATAIQAKVEKMQEKCSTMERSALRKYMECSNIASDVFQQVCKCGLNWKRQNTVCVSTRMVMSCFALVLQISNKLQDRGFGDEEVAGTVSVIREKTMECSKDLRQWIETHAPNELLPYSHPDEIRFWSDIISIDLGQYECSELWRNSLLMLLKARIENLSSDQIVKLFCRYDFKQCNPIIETCISEHACQVVQENWKETVTSETLVSHVDETNDSHCRKYGYLLERMFINAWPEEEENFLHHMLNWGALSAFLKLSLHQRKNMLGTECLERIKQMFSVLQENVQKVCNGSIEVGKLRQILQKKVQFVDLFRLSCQQGNRAIMNDTMLTRILDLREQELKEFEHLRSQIKTFLTLCSEFQHVVETTVLSQRANKNVERLPLNMLCEPVQHSTDPTTEPKIIFFNFDLPATLKYNILQEMEEIQFSRIFLSLWKRYGHHAFENQSDSTLSIDRVIESVWKPTVKQWQNVRQTLKNGAVHCGSVRKLFNEYFDKDGKLKETELCNEFKILARKENDEWIPLRVQQLKWYTQLCQYKEGAEAILKAKEIFQLQGDFQLLEQLIHDSEDTGSILGSITQEHAEVGKAMEDVGKRASIIDEFCRCQPLITWLKENIKDPKEVQTLVELALMTSSGKGDIEVVRVTTLHDAVTGFAPLIYCLDETTNLTTFLNLCKEVWKAVDSDHDLPTKLKDTNRYLDWFKSVNDTHGDVEKSVLAQVEDINKNGIYQVGKIKDNDLKELDDVIQLAISQTKEKYTFSSLTELQSKLMLVAGRAEQGKKHVDRFVEVFDGVTRLAQAYINICNAGSILFMGWKVQIFCEQKRKNSVLIDFGLADQILTGGGSDDVEAHIQNICQFLEQCHSQWLDNIDKEREEHYHLNHYTTAQIVLLRQELGKLSREEGSLSNQIYPLLGATKRNVTELDVRYAYGTAFCELEEIEKAKWEINKQNVEAKVKPGDQHQKKETDLEANGREDNREFIIALQNQGYSEELAQQALVWLGDVDLGDGALSKATLWCMKHMPTQESTEEIEESTHQESLYDREEDLHHNVRSLVLQDTTIERRKEDILQKLRESQDYLVQLRTLWDEFLTQVTISAADYLSVNHLGYVLKYLAKLDPIPQERPMPPYLDVGKTNLITCAQADIFVTVLSIYMNCCNLPLPTSNEVLLCTPDTTAEEVELFWRRAVGDQHGHVFCLANADLLEYDVSEKAEMTLERLTKGKTDYKLVVVCSTEGEDRSTLVTALDSHRVTAPVTHGLEDIRAYLKNHFTKSNPAVAAAVDPERCCIRVITSNRAGCGKSLAVKRFGEGVNKLGGRGVKGKDSNVSIPLQGRKAVMLQVLKSLIEHVVPPGHAHPRQFHLDIAHEIQEGVDALLFNLLILGSISDPSGFVWRRDPGDLYLIETTTHLQFPTTAGDGSEIPLCIHHILDVLPSIKCRDPSESRDIRTRRFPAPGDGNQYDILMDDSAFTSQEFQRVYQYLKQFSKYRGLEDILPAMIGGTHSDCIEYLLRYCGLKNPTWAELSHFVSFLNVQLVACEQSIFCSKEVADDLPEFRRFVVHFMIQMSRDFATRSLDMTEKNPGVYHDEEEQAIPHFDNDFDQHQLARHWNTSPHPYIFFNPDQATMTFLGFNIDPDTCDLLDHQTGEVLEENIMNRTLQQALEENLVPLNENFDDLPRMEKINKLRRVMGIEEDDENDPDKTYELTTDNVKKILAILMRFRCGIPVVVMGETGCGKTRLIKFMCDLQKPLDAEDMQNMVIMKVHGGTTEDDIKQKVEEAAKLAKENSNRCQNVDTVLFFDEANTTEAIGLIKEIMCDGTVHGKPLHDQTTGGESTPPDQSSNTHGLRLIAACNPYRKHTDAMIARLEQAGLGYRVRATETKERLGQIPMRQLVYRVQALPPSMRPLVWDFGQLRPEVEILYIRQIVYRYVTSKALPTKDPKMVEMISRVLATSQDYMRQQEHECSFVSLRDIERAMNVMVWFYSHRKSLFPEIDKMHQKKDRDEEENDNKPQPMDEVLRSLILALGVCYFACLEERESYCQRISQEFNHELLPNGKDTIYKEITTCQDVFLEGVNLESNIAKNKALKENVFMMMVCIELRIPLFLVGKPGSSKSLAKTIVADAMEGSASSNKLFRNFKKVQMVSFQCSPLATPEGIVSTFHQCALLQKEEDLEKFVSVVVLDEIGLAEDSPRMPLKTLHPLLEDGCLGDEKPDPYKKVAFIGISNWALDPAKMNRGILVLRGVPDEKELIFSAKGICSSQPLVQDRINPFIPDMASSYLELSMNSDIGTQEFFGLRDFYSLVKMVFAFSIQSGESPTWRQFEHAIRRNFSGLDSVNPVVIFREKLEKVKLDLFKQTGDDDPDCTAAGLIRAGLNRNDFGSTHESRYLLILTENNAALGILQQDMESLKDAIIIFGSSFPNDQEYTQVCRNINRIKVCMETGKTVVLLNLENLYESLYDALNQYYVYYGGQRFVDLGLGTHRLKCRIHENFRLIVVAEKKVVYERFPIPLINRLEKHFLATNTVLTENQVSICTELDEWARKFVTVDQGPSNKKLRQLQVGDVFIGYHTDTAASVTMQASKDVGQNKGDRDWQRKITNKCQYLLLQCATPDGLLRLRQTALRASEEELVNIYFTQQKHESLNQLLQHLLNIDERNMTDTGGLFVQVTTHSRLLSQKHVRFLEEFLQLKIANFGLQSFDTEQQFCKRLREFYSSNTTNILLIQCESGHQNSSLIACARYNILAEHSQNTAHWKHVVLVVQLPRIAGGCFAGYQGGQWQCFHLDELSPVSEGIPDVFTLRGQPISAVLGPGWISPIDDLSEKLQAVHIYAKDKTPAQPHLDGISLLKNCILAATSTLVDSLNKTRKLQRIQVLKDLFQLPEGNDGMSFKAVVHSRVYQLLRDKELDSMTPQMSTAWLSKEAADSTTISKSGTLRRSVQSCLKDKIAPVLASVVAVADTNYNLDLLLGEPEPWLSSLWLHMFYDTNVANIELASTKVVQTTGCDGMVFHSKCPFSWLIKEQVDSLLQDAHNKGDPDPKKHVEQLMPQTPIGKLLHNLTDTYQSTLVDLYLYDFVRMVYKAKSGEQEREYQLIESAIRMTAKQISTEDRQTSLQFEDRLYSIAAIQEAYLNIKLRLQYFSQAVNACPNVIHNFHDKVLNSDIDRKNEMVLDAQAILLILEDLTPESPKQLGAAQLQQNWIRHVKEASSIIETTLAVAHEQQQSGIGTYGPEGMELLKKGRLIWNRVCAVKLYIDHVCRGLEKQPKLNRAYDLWMVLTKYPNFKTKEYMENVVEFLTSCNLIACKVFYSSIGDCPICGKLVDTPVQLPCGHFACLKCLQDLEQLEDRSCKTCKIVYPQGFQLIPCQEKREAIEAHAAYKKKCNGFFMALVTQLVFENGSPPEGGVIKMLMGCVTRESKLREKQDVEKILSQRNIFYDQTSDDRTDSEMITDDEGSLEGHVTDQRRTTKEFTILDDYIDPTPVVRSVILRMLLKASKEDVHNFLMEFLEGARNLLNNEPSMIQELCQMCVHCFEDSYRMEVSKVAHLTDGKRKRLELAIQYLKDAHDLLRENQKVSIKMLDGVALARFGLGIAASLMYGMFVQKEDLYNWRIEVRALIHAAQYLCETQVNESVLTWPRLYLLKQLSRNYGQDTLHKIAREEDMIWILPPEARKTQTEDHIDRYIIWGEGYQKLREMVAQVVLGWNPNTLIEVFENIPNKECEKEVQLLLAIHAEVTQMYSSDGSKVSDQPLKHLVPLLLRNELGQSDGHLLIQPEKLAEDVILAEIAVHFLVTMLSLDSCPLIQPIMNLMNNPEEMMDSYIPTMPQDESIEVLNAIRPGEMNYGITYWECPNGHKYIIGDCGRPWDIGTCNECGEEIGGSGHREIQGNKKILTLTENIETGHILGSPNKRNLDPVPERLMTPASTAILRLLTHLAMYHAATCNPHAVAPIIQPAIDPQDVATFLWDHLKQDLHAVSRALHRNRDDSASVLHVLIRDLFEKSGEDNDAPRTLEDKEERKAWEADFCNTYVLHITTDLDGILQAANEEILKDKRLENSPLLQILCEVRTTEAKEEDLLNLVENEVLWRFRSQVTVEHLSQFVQERCPGQGDEQHSLTLLTLFLQKAPYLQAMQFLPSIIRLQRYLVQRHSRKITFKSAGSYHWRNFVTDLGNKKKEMETLQEDYSRAWRIVRQALPTHKFGIKIPHEYFEKEIDGNTSLAYLMPSLRGPGVCAAAMVHYLVSLHNSIINDIECITDKRSPLKLSVNEATSAHLVSYDTDRDLLPLVLANCNYSLEPGKGSHLEYDIPTIQDQIYERFLKGRPHLRYEISSVHFFEDITNTAIFEKLKKKIPQEPLERALQHRIQEECNQEQIVSDVLNNLDITLQFLVSTGGDPNVRLVDFMSKIPEMNVSSMSLKAQQKCSLKHVQSLWLLLSHKRAQLMITHGQAPFEGQVDEGYCKMLGDDQVQELYKALHFTSKEIFLAELYECIMLKITVPQDSTDPDGETDNKEFPLCDVLKAYIASKDGNTINVLENGKFPPNILAKHSIDTWCHAWRSCNIQEH